jgi:GDP-4-dehydro-6-deoxy-D-mannose reductase
MRVMVTGAAGFVGRHAARELAAHGHEVLAVDHQFPAPVECAAQHRTADIRERGDTDRLVADLAPDACLHLAGIAFVPSGNSNPDLVYAVNLFGTIHVLEAIRRHTPTARVLVASSAHIYGVTLDTRPHHEDSPLNPDTLYAASKASADLTTLAYAQQFNLPAMTARPNNHTGPGQSPQFATASFVQQVKAIRDGEAAPRLSVGNLDAERDFTDVRDVVAAYRLLLEKGQAGQAYNISSGQMIRMRKVVDAICALADVTPEIVVDPAKVRPANRSPVLDVSRIRTQTGWAPRYALTETLHDMLGAA